MLDLTTTNVLLGIMAVVSVIEAVALIVAGVVGKRLYREISDQIQTLEQRHLAPLSARMLPLMDNAKALSVQAGPLLDDTKGLIQSMQRASERIEHSLSRMDDAVQGTLDTAGQAVDKVQGGMRRTAGTVVGVVRGVRTAIETFLADQPNGTKAPGASQPDTGDEAAPPGATSASYAPRSHVIYPERPFSEKPGTASTDGTM